MLDRRGILAAAAALLPGVARADEGGILVFGATGQTGSSFIAALPPNAGTVTAFIRPTSKRDRLDGRRVAYAVGDVWDAPSVRDAIGQAKPRVIFVAVQGRPNQRSPYVGAAQHIVGPAKATGVKQLIWIGQAGSGPSGVVRGYADINYALFEKELAEMSEAERILAESGLPLTVIRVGAIISDRLRGAHPPTGQGRLVADERTFGPIAYGDLGRLAAGCVDNPSCVGRVFHATDDTLGADFARWRCRRFASNPDAECGR